MKDKFFPKKLQQHIFTRDGQVYLFDINHTLFFKISPLVQEVVQLSEKLNEDEILSALRGKYTKIQIRLVIDQIIRYYKKEFFRVSVPQKEDFASLNYGISLCISHECALDCSYCYAKGGRNYSGKKRIMSRENALKAMNFLFSEFSEAKTYGVCLTTGGDAFLNFRLLKEIKLECEKWQQKLGKKIDFSFTLNGLNISPEIVHFLHDFKKDGHITISLDGPQPIHDRMRHFPSGEGSFEKIHKNIQALLNHKEFSFSANDFAVSAVLTANYPNIREIYSFLYNYGFRTITIRPVRSSPNHDFAITSDNFGEIEKAYKEYIHFLIEKTCAGEYLYVLAILNNGDFLGRILMNTSRNGGKIRYRCDAGKYGFSITANGAIYPCDKFVNDRRFRMGTLQTGLDEKLQEAYLYQHVDNLKLCKDCWGRYICGGPCLHQSLMVNGSIEEPDEVQCALTLFLIEQSIFFWSEVAEKAPAFLETYTQQKWNRHVKAKLYYSLTDFADQMEEAGKRANSKFKRSFYHLCANSSRYLYFTSRSLMKTCRAQSNRIKHHFQVFNKR